MMRENCTILMMRCPERGRVKTRLANRIGDDEALRVYSALLEDTIIAVETSASDTILSVYDDSTGSIDLDKPFRDMNRIRQKGGDLGERQFNSLREGYGIGYRKAMVIAGDSPEISAVRITEAFNAMDHADAVIGPCHDGGYYLLGIRASKLATGIFRDIGWGEETVLDELKRNLEYLGLSHLEMDPLHDVDTVEDLALFMRREVITGAPITHGVISKLVEEGSLSFG